MSYKINLVLKNPIPRTLMGFGTDQGDFVEILNDTIYLVVRPLSLQDDDAIERANHVIGDYVGHEKVSFYFDFEIVIDEKKSYNDLLRATHEKQ